MPARRPLMPTLLALLAPHPDGLRIIDCWHLLGEARPYNTIQSSLQALARCRVVRRLRRGRYALTPGARLTLGFPLGPHTLALPVRVRPPKPGLCPRGCGRLATRQAEPCCLECLWHALEPTHYPPHNQTCDRRAARRAKARTLAGRRP